MLRSYKGNPTQAETASVIKRIVQRQAKPVTLEGIHKELPGLYKMKAELLAPILDEQVRMKAIHEWPVWKNKKRFWIYELKLYAQRSVLEILSEQPLTRNQLQNALKSRLFGCSAYRVFELMKKILVRLLEQKCLYEHPPTGRRRLSRFGIRPPALEPYFQKVKEDFRHVCQKLNKAGIPRNQVLEIVNEIFYLPDPGSDDTAGSKIDYADVAGTIPSDVFKEILSKIVEIEPAARQQVLVPIQTLRTGLNLSKIIFDRAILQLAEKGEIFLHRHVYPSQTTDGERCNMVTDGHGNYYMGVVLRN
jgi:hypothetical protein